MAIEVSNTGIDLENSQIKDELNDLQDQLLEKPRSWLDTSQPQTPEKVKELPQELKNYRQAWDKNIKGVIDETTKNKIKNIASKLPLTAEKQSDGSTLIELTLWNKKYKILNINLSNHTDDSYKESYKFHITWMEWTEVKRWWMLWDDVNKWKNQKLKSYVKQQQSKWLHIPKAQEMHSILDELWRTAWLTKDKDKIAMLMYLTGMEWVYFHRHINDNYGSALNCGDTYRWHYLSPTNHLSFRLCMIAW